MSPVACPAGYYFRIAGMIWHYCSDDSDIVHVRDSLQKGRDNATVQ
jgi:hypothetical protein